MTLRHMQIFLAVCEKMNMTLAANALYITQPSVSQAIKELEEHYSSALFERKGRNLSITREGEILRSYAIHIVSAFDEVEKKLAEHKNTDALRIGANVTVGVTMIQSLILTFKKTHPDVRIEVCVNNSKTIREKIDRDELDFALVEELADMSVYRTESFYEDRNTLVAPPNHRLAKLQSLTVRDLQSEEILLREKGSGVRNLFDAVMLAKGITVHPAWESYTSDALIEAVKAGIGIAVLPERIVRPHVRAGEMTELKITDLDLSRRLVILMHRGKALSKEAEEFISLVKSSDWNDNGSC